ncbi:flagellar hook protein FlgE [Massilia sp. W12]|uniref:flagellar hook protein FlgE n=1 Tax=Massilia sp. W12 TaxID=3126507 RepID=UPI0030D4FA10
MSFQQGLSGLNGAAKSLDVIGNNVANASTVGFKLSKAQFADVYASSLTGATGNQAGIGTKVVNIAQQFTQGNIGNSNNPLDIAINGGGFFRMTYNGTAQYSRNGQFQLDRNGYIVNAQGANLTGYMANALGVLSTGAPVSLQVNTADLPPKVTEKVAAVLNLDSRAQVPRDAPFSPDVPTSYNSATSVNIFDTLGNPHVMQTFYVKTGPSTWDVYATSDGIERSSLTVREAANDADRVVDPPPTPASIAAAVRALANATQADATAARTTADAARAAAVTPDQIAQAEALTQVAVRLERLATFQDNAADAGDAEAADPNATRASVISAVTIGTPANPLLAPPAPIARLVFTPLGALDTATKAGMPFRVDIPVHPPTGALSPISMEVDYSGTTQFGSNFSTNALKQDGYTSGRLSGFSTSSDGLMVARYTNGQSNVLAQLVLANFTNPNGLAPLGNNAWAETAASGAALVGVPNSASLGVLQASAVEDSNVDLTQELVEMITAQRVYQANAQTIKTQDSVLQTLVNLR